MEVEAQGQHLASSGACSGPWASRPMTPCTGLERGVT